MLLKNAVSSTEVTASFDKQYNGYEYQAYTRIERAWTTSEVLEQQWHKSSERMIS
jgi:hypothetical protein